MDSTPLLSFRAQYGSRKIEGKGYANIEWKKSVENRNALGLKQLPCMFHGLGELLRPKSIQHVFFCHPRPTGLQDTKADLLHVRRVVRVSIDDDLHPVLLGLAEMNVVQVETVGISVKLHSNFVLRGCCEDGVHVELISIATQLDASG